VPSQCVPRGSTNGGSPSPERAGTSPPVATPGEATPTAVRLTATIPLTGCPTSECASWSPDGQAIAFTRANDAKDAEALSLDRQGPAL
jgi:dipeptidyl aminopeptidase/acylaminoacyl peptidase